MKMLVLEPGWADFTWQQFASSWFCCFDWLKLRCNKLESIQSCEFWQVLNKMEVDRYTMREPSTPHTHTPITCCWTRSLSAICHPSAHIQRGAITETRSLPRARTHAHIDTQTFACQRQLVCTAYFIFKAHAASRCVRAYRTRGRKTCIRIVKSSARGQ